MRRSGISLRFTRIEPEVSPARNSFSFGFLLHTVAALEALQATGRIDDPMLTGEKRVTTAAHLDTKLRFRRPGLPGCPTRGAMHGCLNVIWMDLRFHGSLLAWDDAYFLPSLFIIRSELHFSLLESKVRIF